MNRFDYREARTIDEAVDILSREDGGRLVAGATDVLIRWRQGAWKPRYVLNIKRIAGLDAVHYDPGEGLRLGALVNVRTLEKHPLIRQHYPALTQAATAFAGVQIRNLATVGGNVCNASWEKTQPMAASSVTSTISKSACRFLVIIQTPLIRSRARSGDPRAAPYTMRPTGKLAFWRIPHPSGTRARFCADSCPDLPRLAHCRL